MTANLTCLQSPLRVMASGVRLSGFDPRSRAGSDADVAMAVQLRPSFDPRSRAGSDAALRRSVQRKGVSIHAPARGATLGSTILRH